METDGLEAAALNQFVPLPAARYHLMAGTLRADGLGNAVHFPLMKSSTFVITLLVAIFFLVPYSSKSLAGGMDEKQKIEALIVHVEGLKNASFIRNGRSYSAQNAGKFLRGKWDAHTAGIKSAADFIEMAASVSSTSGKPYLIRFKDGKETKCGDYLRAQLQLLEKKP